MNMLVVGIRASINCLVQLIANIISNIRLRNINMLTQAELKEYLHYDPLSGIFTRLKSSNQTKVGGVAGWTQHGYSHIKIKDRSYRAHRLAWLYMYGTLPAHRIDHINRIKSDNRITNLREASASENAQNRVDPNLDGTSGFLGVSFHRVSQKFRATIRLNSKLIHIGMFNTAEEASQAHLAVKAKVHVFCPVAEPK